MARKGGIETESRTINLSSSMTAAQIQERIDEVGTEIPHDVVITFQFADGTYNTGMTSSLNFQGFYGGGTINVYGHSGEAGSGTLHTSQNVILDFSSGSSNGLYFKNNEVTIDVLDMQIKISDTAQVAGIAITGNTTSGTIVHGCYVLGSGKTNINTGIRAQTSLVQFTNNYVSNVYYGIAAEYMSKLYSNNNDDTGTLPNYGLYTGMGSTIGKGSTQPSGSTANEYPTSGVGKIETVSRTINLDNSMTAAQIQAKIDAVGKYIPPGVVITFQFADGTYNTGMSSPLYFQGFYGGGQINVYGHSGESGSGTLHTSQNVILDFSSGSASGLYFKNNDVTIDVLDIQVKISDTAQVAGITLLGQKSSGTTVHGCYVLGSGKTNQNFGIRALSSLVQFENNYVSNIYNGIDAELMSILYSINNDDTGTLPNYGLNAGMGSTIGKNSTQPSGSTANENAWGGARIA